MGADATHERRYAGYSPRNATRSRAGPEAIDVMRAELSREMVRLSRAQNGVILTEQLYAAGLTRDAIRARVKRGRMVRLFRGVYTTGDPELMPLARATAAVLVLGAHAVLSHRSAAALHGLADPDPLAVDVTVAGRGPRSRSGIHLHRTGQLDSRDITTHSNIAVTAVARTLIDFASEAGSSEIARAFSEARAKRAVTDSQLAQALHRAPSTHRGASIVRAMLRDGSSYDRSVAERVMRERLGQADLPPAIANVIVNGYLVDFLWPDAKVILEVDGYATHGSRDAFERDRKRDQVHAAAGYIVIRITWHQLINEPLAVIARIAQALARREAE